MIKNKFKFKFDSKIKEGYYSAVYFGKTTKIVKECINSKQNCTMQFTFFGDEPVKVCGIEESVQMLKTMLGPKDFRKIKIFGVNDGDVVKPKTSVLLIQGPYYLFGIYENVIDGILARRSSVCNNCYKLLQVIDTKKVLFMADRTDDYLVQKYDGYSAYIGGIRNFVTPASAEYLKGIKDVTVSGTIPHALIQQFNGNLSSALKAYAKTFKNDKLVALIDYHNDVENEIISLAKSGIKKIDFIRIDTSKNIVDFSLQRRIKNWKLNKKLYGVNQYLVDIARKTLDKCGYKNTKIIVSSGLDVESIKNFIKVNSPIDAYGIGSSLITRNVHFSADLVMNDNKPESKYGRKLFTNINKLNKLN